MLKSQDSSKVCFVVSPIGKEDSDIRVHADDLYDLVIKPALEKFGFGEEAVVRADKLPGPTRISTDIVHLLQTADLCVIVLTYQNPNVFYECGRRHETGKPFVHMIKKDEALPFDVADYRTIQYDLSTPRSVQKAINDLQRFMADFEQSEYGAESSGVSLAAVVSSLDRLERKLDRISVAPTPSGRPTPGHSVSLDMFFNPHEAFAKAVMNGDSDAAASLLDRLSQIESRDEFVKTAAIVASAGNEQAAQKLLQILEEHAATLDYEVLEVAVGAAVRYYNLTDKEDEATRRLEPILRTVIARPDLNSEQQAFLWNQLQKIYYGAHDYRNALTTGLKSAELNPNCVAYRFNLSLVYEKLGDLNRAVESVDNYMAMPDEKDDDHLMQAVELYARSGRKTDAQQAFDQLRAISEMHASMILLDDDVRRVIT